MAHERRIGIDERVTRAGSVYDYHGSRSFSLLNQKELKASVSMLPNSFELSSAGKSLLVDVDFGNTGELRVQTSPLNSQVNLNGQTKRLYDDALELMFRIANALGRPVNYRLVTEDRDVISWAKSPNGLIDTSGWDRYRFITETQLEATKRITPVSSNSSNGHQS